MDPDSLAAGTVRRTFLSRVTALAAGLGLGASARPAAAQAPATGNWQPASHAEDDWYDQVPGRHRFFFDTVSVSGLGEGLVYATNYFAANRSGYDLTDADLAVVLCLRHFSTPFAFTDAIWARYGAAMSGPLALRDPKTDAAPVINVYRVSGYGGAFPNRGITLDDLIGRGAHFAVCGMATRAFAGIIAGAVGGNADAIFEELTANMIPNAHQVSAGIVAVERAQAHRYAFSYVG